MSAHRCAVCEGGVEKIFVVDGHEIFECHRCAHRMTWPRDPRTHVREVYSDDYFRAGGAGYPNYLEEEPLMIRRGRWYAALMERYSPRAGVALDVGAAAGFVLKGLTDAGWQGVGVEPNAWMAEYARRELQLDVRTGTLESFETESKFDLICFLQVLSHFIDPRLALQRAAGLLSPDGHLLIETWNWKSRTARFFGTSWHQYSPPSVLHWFCPSSLARLTAGFGLEEVGSGRPRKRLTGSHARSLLSFKSGQGPLAEILEWGASIIPNRMELPYPFDDVRWYLFKRARFGESPSSVGSAG